MNNGFDKNAFKKSQKALKTTAILMILIGVVSIICSIFVGNGLFGDLFSEVDEDQRHQDFLDEMNSENSNGEGNEEQNGATREDPKNYYGTYYSAKDYVIDKIEISETKAKITTVSVIVAEKTDTYKYTFVSAGEASAKYGRDSDVLVIYKDSVDTPERLLWFSDNPNVSFWGNDDRRYVKDPLTMKALMGDPADYYGNYVFDAGNSLVVNADGTATFTLNGVQTRYKYFYANNDWLTNHLQKNYKEAIVLHNNNENELHVFAIAADGNLIYGNTYTFVKQ